MSIMTLLWPAGREIGGWPKKMATINFDRIGNQYRCSLERHGQRLASSSIDIGGKLLSTPLPADKAVSLPYPWNMTLPLPPPTGKEQATVPLPTASLKVVPQVGSDDPVVARVIGSPWHMKGDFYKGSNAHLSIGSLARIRLQAAVRKVWATLLRAVLRGFTK